MNPQEFEDLRSLTSRDPRRLRIKDDEIKKPMRFTTRIFETQQHSFMLWIPVFFGGGVVFYLSFPQNFIFYKTLFATIFCCALLFSFLNRHSLRSLIYIACATFLCGSFYVFFYENYFVSETKITGKVYVDVIGKVESVKKFYNPVNHLEGANLVVSETKMYKSKFVAKKKVVKKKAKKKKVKKKKPSSMSSSRKRGSKTKNSKQVERMDPRLREDDKGEDTNLNTESTQLSPDHKSEITNSNNETSISQSTQLSQPSPLSSSRKRGSKTKRSKQVERMDPRLREDDKSEDTNLNTESTQLSPDLKSEITNSNNKNSISQSPQLSQPSPLSSSRKRGSKTKRSKQVERMDPSLREDDKGEKDELPHEDTNLNTESTQLSPDLKSKITNSNNENSISQSTQLSQPSPLSSSRKRGSKTKRSKQVERMDPRLREDDTERENTFEKKWKTIEKNYINLSGYQEIDREFLDLSKNYQQVAWREIKGREVFPNPPQKVSVNLVKNFSNISVNDKIAFRALLQPPDSAEFLDDFNFEIDAKSRKIGAYGFVIGKAHILTKSEISGLESWFLNIREKIRAKISASLSGDEKAIALAFLIGDQNEISKELMQKIRSSGLAHLLSISGFHLSLAGAIFFVSSRFLLSRSEYLALNFDLKKIAAFFSIFATYFYLKIAASPLPAQRAFLMIFLVFLSLMFSEKINSRRAIMASALLLIIYNPYIIFSVSFQLSFIAVLTLGIFYEEIKMNFSPKILRYFFEIILLSIFIQITTLPFLMHSFQNLAALGFIANITAIPLTSFLIMPLGFLALFLMPINLENYVLLGMNEGIFLLEKIINYVAAFDYSNLLSPRLPSAGLAISTIGLMIFLLQKSVIRFLGIIIFCCGFLTIFFIKKPTLIFEQNQKFFAIYDDGNLFFSEKLKPTKQRQHWMNHFGETEFKMLNFCKEKSCEFEIKNKKILVLLKRNRISEICKKDFDLVVNMTAKYELPACVKTPKLDNKDFLKGGAKEIYFEGS